MFADDIESHIHASDGHEAETLLTRTLIQSPNGEGNGE